MQEVCIGVQYSFRESAGPSPPPRHPPPPTHTLILSLSILGEPDTQGGVILPPRDAVLT